MNKKILLISIIITVAIITNGFAHSPDQTTQIVVHNGIGLGAAIAVAISWSRKNSILWAIIHGILSWLYVIYYFITR